MSNYDNNTTRRFPAAFGSQRRGGGVQQRGGGPRRYQPQEVRYPAPEKKEEPKTVDLTSEMNFPSLGGGSAWGAAAGAGSAKPAGRSFATMASDWKETEEAEAARIAYEREQQEIENRRNRGMLTSIFTKSRLYTESKNVQEYYDQEYDDDGYKQPSFGYPEDEGWNTIDNSIKTKYTDRGSRWESDEDDEY